MHPNPQPIHILEVMSPLPENPSPVEPPADQAVWDELEMVLDELAGAARQPQPTSAFYRAVIARLAPLLAATHAVVWVREAGKLRIAAQTAGWAESTADRKAVEHMIAAAFETSDVVSLAPGTTLDGVTNPTDEHYLIAPVTLHDWTPADGPAVAVIGCTLPAGRAPSSYRGAEQLLTGVSDLAAEYHVRRNLERLTSERDRDRQRAQFAEQVGGDTDLVRTAMAIANEGRRIVPCDRLSVLTVTGSRGRLLAASGTDHVERRSRAARALEQLASIAVRMDEPIDYSDRADQPTDLAPQLDELVSKYVDEFHTRRLLVVPMPQARHATHNAATRGVLVAEQFGGTTPELDRLAVAELARTAAPPLASAIAWHELPLGSFVQSLAWLKMPRTMFRLALGAALLVGIATALLMIQRPLTIDVRGQLLPMERREVFAPRSGIVDSLAAEHGQRVAAGDTIVVLRDPELAAERERLRGEQTTTQRQLEAIRATRSVAGTPSRDPLELYRLSGEEAELSTQLTNLDRQSRLIEQQTAALTVVSPIAGAVTTWQVDERLAPGRPVERGQVLASVADTAGDWMLELMVPDERLDLLRQSTGEQLMVEYRLGSDASALHTATVSRIAQRADLVATPAGDERREVRVEAIPNTAVPAEFRTAALRPGGSVRARILVGYKPLAFVLFHDLWRTIRNWWEF